MGCNELMPRPRTCPAYRNTPSFPYTSPQQQGAGIVALVPTWPVASPSSLTSRKQKSAQNRSTLLHTLALIRRCPCCPPGRWPRP